MQFKPGESGNPEGRPKGSLNKRTQLVRLLEPRAEELVNKMVELALGGDSNALRLCIERLIPKASSSPIIAALPDLDINKAGSSIEIITEVMKQMLAGEVSPDQGKAIISLIEDYRRMLDSRKSSFFLEPDAF
ncbi:DUF5681 domain-containing protein [Aquicella lusitana]|uniref:DUF5681 domain-containing protein n=1 Tax=Aquicella lusitana TaxID=254246 RepID=A0A370FZV8_9COXI|nr:DUF5681 domain-containing protein [Aquicella lusitana]RDI37197.1 hypothetical protein C8D86_1425 [Aquicella lusitana]VVC72563.1 hypothetical protein AQULUS_02750 [Aquicella lusitana]